MKYWLFDGEDVIGPFSPQEITARAGFSDSILVCPETQSEDENAWQTAAHFADFTPHALTRVSQAMQAQSSATSAAPVKSDSEKVPLERASIPISHAEEDLVLPTEAAQESAAENLSAQTENSADTQKETKATATPKEQSAPQDAPTPQASSKESPVTPAPEEKESLSKNKIDPGLWPELSLHSLPILGVSENTLPPLPQGNVPFYVPGKEPATWNQPQDFPAQQTTPKQDSSSAKDNVVAPKDQKEVTAPKETPAKEETLPAQNKSTAQSNTSAPEKAPTVTPQQTPQPVQKNNPVKKEEPVKAQTPAKATPVANKAASARKKPLQKAPVKKHAQPAVLPAEIPEDAPEDFFAQTLSPFSQIPKELVQAQDEESIARIIQNPVPPPQEPEDFIPQKPAVSNIRFLLFIGLFLVLLFALVLTGVWLARSKRARTPFTTPFVATTQVTSEEDSSTQQTPATEEKPSSAKVTRPEISVPPPPPAVTVSPLQEKALAVAKNYTLSGERGTVENYFNKLYAVQLSQGYQATWSAEPLHKNTYIVKYRLTKTRTEPIMYVFQVDAAAGKLTGALNNITLDLVGKI